MQIINALAIILIILGVIGIILWYAKQLRKSVDEEEYESAYSLSYLTDGIAQVFADIQKTNLNEQNLSKKEREAEQRKKLELRRNLKKSAFGDLNAKKYIKSMIKEILQGKRFGINEENIDLIIPFNHPKALDTRSKVEIVFYLFYERYGINGFKELMKQYKLNTPKNLSPQQQEDGQMLYEITEEDINEVYNDINSKNTLTYDDKLEIVAQRIFSNYKGMSVVDMLFDFSLDEIDCGVSGVPKDTYELKKELMTKNFEYSFNSIFVVFSGINIKLSCLTFGSQEELVRVCRNIYKFSAPYALSKSKGFVIGTMKDGSRIAVARPPAAGSWCFFARKFDSTPSLAPEALITDKNCEIPITVLKWIMKTSCSAGVTGGMGTGKSTLLKALIRYILHKNIRVYELSPELNLQFTYPQANIVNFATTESISMQELYDFGKKSNATTNIVGESASAEMGVIVVESATVGSEQALFSNHANTAADLVLCLRDNLTMAGGYSSEKVAEEVVAKCINFDIHMGREKGHRFVERITEIIPIRDRSYPFDKNHKMSEEDTVEYYKRQTDRLAFETRDIMVYQNGEYVMVNPISDVLKLHMRNKLREEDEALFLKDMQILESTIKKTRKKQAG